MKVFIFFAICCSSIICEQPRYAVTLISLMPKSQTKSDYEILQQDRRSAYSIVMKHLKPHCRFFDEDLYRKRIDDMYRKNPDLDPTDLQNKLAALSLPTKLIVVIKTEVSTIQDAPFERVYRHQAETTIKVVDQSGWSEIYAQVKGKTSKLILVPPLDGKTPQHWQTNRSSRHRAIEESVSPLIPELVNQLDVNKEILNAFDFLAVRLFAEKKNAMWQLLDALDATENIKVRDKRYTTDQGIASKIICENGITAFVSELQKRFLQYPALENMVCDFDGLNVKVYPKEVDESPLTPQQKFTGTVVLASDIKHIKEKKLTQLLNYETNQQILKDAVWEQMQSNYRMFDASDLWKKLKDESMRMQVFAASNPTDYIAKKNHLATHTMYYWATTEFKVQQQKYCFAKIGIRIVRMVTAETVAYYQLNSADEFQRGVMVTRDEEHARRKAITALAKRAVHKVTTLLAQEKNFAVYQPRIAIAADNFSNEQIEKLKSIFTDIEQEGFIEIANNFASGEAFLRCEITPKETTTQPRLRQILLEYAEDAGILIKMQTEIGKIYITPADRE
ncbi:hypothetical protein [Candidatus Uabimicrobium sp. HlEnr_7]|uniref:hypothetical protein n=1 Tax=Candidatus Uabimicrobium helgolandensis TaxID=3095367 RepID=UPI003557AD79